jgi:hypothetical protein
MTCFWDGIIQALEHSDYNTIGCNTMLNKHQLIEILKTKNIRVNNVSWNGNKLPLQERNEHYDAVNNYDNCKIGGGHLCSSCDSFLLLISELFEVNIKHLYLNIEMEYKNNKAIKTLNFASNRGHFWKIK